MKRNTISMAAAILVLSTIGTAALADNHHEPEKDSDAHVSISKDALVSGRRAGFWMSAGLFGGMHGVIESGGDVKGLAFAAGTLARWAKAMPDLFPKDAVNDKSNALPSVWNDREGFLATAALYQERTSKLAELAKAGDNIGFKAQWAVVRETCSSCHDSYRKKRDPAGN